MDIPSGAAVVGGRWKDIIDRRTLKYRTEAVIALRRKGVSFASGSAAPDLSLILKDQGRLNAAIAVYRQLLQIDPEDIEGLNGLARVLSARGDAAGALETVQQSLRIKETASAKRIFVDIIKHLRWVNDSYGIRHAMARALTEP